MEQMYKGIPFSPTATLTANISATDTIIPVSDVDAFPDAPNIATIGSIAGPNETVIYTGKTTTSLTGCTRGVEGVASDWMTDELIGRNFTAKDHADMVKNIEELENNKLDATYKVDVVNTADVSAGGKALDARQNNPNITGTLAQKVDSNTQRINVLEGKFAKTTFTITPETGYAITEQNCYIQNKKAYIKATITKTDSTNFAVADFIKVGTLPTGFGYGVQALSTVSATSNNLPYNNGNAILWDANLFIPVLKEVDKIYITGVYPYYQ